MNPIIAMVDPVPRIYFRGWGAQGFATPEDDLPSLEFLKCTRLISPS